MQEPDPDKATPGPGTYTAAAAQRPTSAPLHHTHAAVGSSHRSPHRSLKITAGGGIVVGGISTAAAGGVFPSPRHKQPLFARSAGRSAALSAGPGWSLPPSKSVAPGPGTYNLRQPPAASTLTSLGAAAAASGVGGGCGGGSVCGGVSPPRSHRLLQGGSGFVDQQAAAAAGDDQQASAAAAVGGFGCSSHRFGDNSTVSPGPGGCFLVCSSLDCSPTWHVESCEVDSWLMPSILAQHDGLCSQQLACTAALSRLCTPPALCALHITVCWLPTTLAQASTVPTSCCRCLLMSHAGQQQQASAARLARQQPAAGAQPVTAAAVHLMRVWALVVVVAAAVVCQVLGATTLGAAWRTSWRHQQSDPLR